MNKIIEQFSNLFPVWAVLFSVFAFIFPSLLSDLSYLIIPLLTIIMLGMGMTLTLQNFREVFKSPKIILVGISIQYLVMPLAAFIIARLFNLSAELTAGMVLVGSSAGGTASNVITFLAKGNVALSITMTMASTILAVFATPLLCLLYLNQTVNVPAGNMLFSIFQIVILPVFFGVFINSFFRTKMEKVKSIFPLISILSIIFIIGIIVAINKSKLTDIGFIIIFAVILHNTIGLIAGYSISKILKFDEAICRTVAIEVGMQNSGLSVALAVKFFSNSAAIPGAVFSIWHNISGSILAGYWRKRNH